MRSLRYLLLFFILGFLIFFPILTAGFAADDYPQLIHQPFFHHLNAAFQVFNKVIASQSGHNQFTGFFYRPLTFAIYAIIYNLFHANPFPLHLLQLLLYIVVTYLLFLFFTHYFSHKLSLLLAFIFLIHPANNELAAYIAALSDTLALFFGLLALNLIHDWKLELRNWKLQILISFFLFSSLLSKETGLLFIFLSLLSLTKKSHLLTSRKPASYLIYFSSIVPLICYIPLRLSASAHPMFVYLSNPQFSPHTNRFVFLPQILLAFFSEILTPTRKPIHDSFFHNSISADILPSLMLIIIFFAGFLFWQWIKTHNPNKYQSSEQLLLFYAWIIIGLLLYLQIFPLEFLFAERWLYVTEIGILGVVGTILTSLPHKKNKWIKLCFLLATLLVLLYIGETIHLNFLWHNWQLYLA